MRLVVSLLALLLSVSTETSTAETPATERPAAAVATETPQSAVAKLSCPRYKVYYIDPSAQFFTPPVPLEDHAEFVFCSEHPNLDEIRVRLKKSKYIRSQADLDGARIKVVPRGRADDSITFCSSGEITYKGKQYRLDRRLYEPSLISLREEGDRQRATAEDAEADDDDAREPASKKSQGRQLKN